MVATSRSDAPIVVERITVKRDRIAFDIRLDSTVPLSTTPAIAQRALALRPQLARHTCVNAGGTVFGDVIESTSTVHLLEHVAVDCLVQAAHSNGRQATFTGTSEWSDKAARRAHIELSYVDDLETLAAFNQALDEVARLVGTSSRAEAQ